MASPHSDDSFAAVTASAIALTNQFETLLHSIALDKVVQEDKTTETATTTPDAAVQADIDPLDLAHDSASLIKAHTTKLSLLIINEPFTPSAIAKVLRELVAGPIPALASAVQVCKAERYTAIARRELAWRCYRVLKELKAFLEIIPQDGKVLSGNRKNGAGGGDKGSLVSTGVVWAACDEVMSLRKIGIAGLLIEKIEEYRDTLQDVLDELKEWSLETDDEEDDVDDDDDAVNEVTGQLQNSHLSAQEMIDDLMNPQHIPRDDPDNIRPRLDLCLSQLRLTTYFYTALIKRRLKELPKMVPNDPNDVAHRIDELFPLLKSLADHYGEAAMAFYELDPAAIDRILAIIYKKANEAAASTVCSNKWVKESPTLNDEFMTWTEKFRKSLRGTNDFNVSDKRSKS